MKGPQIKRVVRSSFVLLALTMLICAPEVSFFTAEIAFAADSDTPRVSKKRERSRRNRKQRASKPKEVAVVSHVEGKNEAITHQQLNKELTASIGADVVLLIDSSNSMKRTDKNRLRDQGGKLLARFMAPNDRLAVVQFDESATVKRPLSPVGEGAVEAIDKAIDEIEISGGWTNLKAAVDAALTMLSEQGRNGAAKYVVLLSDGTMDPHPRDGTPELLKELLFEDSIKRLAAARIRLYTLAMSPDANVSLLRDMAIRTGGKGWYTKSPSAIHQKYTELFLALRKPQLVPLESNQFRIDSAVREAIFFVSRKNNESEVRIVNPHDRELTHESPGDRVNWYHAGFFDVITIKEPTPGIWELKGLADPSGFAKILTDLKLQVKVGKTQVRTGDTVRVAARLAEGEEVFNDPQVQRILSYSYELAHSETQRIVARGVLLDDGTNGDGKASDTIFSRYVKFEEPGNYLLEVRAMTPSFTRVQKVPVQVSQALITLRHEAEDLFTEKPERLVVTLGPKLARLKSSEVSLAAVHSETQTAYALEVSKAKNRGREFTALVKDLEIPNGSYRVEARFNGERKGGSKTIRTTSNSVNITVNRPKAEAVVEKEPPVDTSAYNHALGAICVLALVGWVAFLWRTTTAKLSAALSGDGVKGARGIDKALEERINALQSRASSVKRGANEADKKLFSEVPEALEAVPVSTVAASKADIQEADKSDEHKEAEEVEESKEAEEVEESKEAEVAADESDESDEGQPTEAAEEPTKEPPA